MVNVTNPSLKNRETVLDPACGTGGFLIESHNYCEKQVKGTKDNEFLQQDCISGIEPRPEPYLYGMMNMMLHGIERPNIARVNTLETKLSDIQDNLQHDIIVTNPPFGGEENDSIKKKLPAGFQTKDTALGFLLHCMARLKEGGKCAIILPNGPLFATGMARKIKEKLLQECNLHTIIRLPGTVFTPYTTIATNILFFDKTEPTKEIWYYQMKVDERLRGASRAKNPKYTMSNPILYEDFEEIEEWIKDKKENENAWKISVDALKDYNLDLNNPSDVEETIELSPHELIDITLKDGEKMMKLLREVQDLIKKEIPK